MTPPAPASSARRKVRRVMLVLRPWRGRGLGVAGLVALQGLLSLVPAILVADLTRELTADDVQTGTLLEIVGIAAAATLAAAALGALAAVGMARIASGTASLLRRRIFGGVMDEGQLERVAARGGDASARMLQDVAVIATGLRDHGAPVIAGGVTAAGALVAMLVISWQLALVALALLPVAAVVSRLAGRSVYRTQAEVQAQFGEVTSFATEAMGLSGHMLIRSFGRGAAVKDRFAELDEALHRHEIDAVRTVQRLRVASEAVLVLVGAAFVGVAAALAGDGHLAFPDLVAFVVVALGRFGPALFAVASGGAVFLGSLAAWDRVLDVLERSESEPRPGTLAVRDGRLEARGLTFTYPGQERPAVDGFDLVVEPGRVAALVGPSGAGKTTVTALLAGYLAPDAGSISIDGQDTRGVSVASLADAVGVVLQDAFLFHDTLRANLLLARPDADDEALSLALAAANLTAVVERLPEGLDTVVGERGHRLSGGEKQRLALARVILRDPPILILDEATSHLDSQAERLVQEALAALMAGRTSIVIAHRLSTIVAADQIVVLDRGHVVTRGTHDELLAHGGLYADLHRLQTGVEADTR